MSTTAPRRRMPIAARQEQAIQAVRELNQRGYCPTLREIADRLGVSLPWAQQLVDRLVAEGKLWKADRTPRTIREAPQEPSHGHG